MQAEQATRRRGVDGQGCRLAIEPMEIEMRLIGYIFARRGAANITTVMERRRLAASMPGQTGAVSAARLGHTLA